MSFDLVREALLASGVKEDEGVADYIEKMYHLHQQFIEEMNHLHGALTIAKALFDRLWSKKPARYEPHGHFRLTEAVDSQLRKDSRSVGNCLGLTLLYNCLLRRAGIKAGALHLENAFGRGPHVLTLLKTNYSTIDIENILMDGFDYQGHLKDPSRTLWGDRELVADIYHSQGNECFEKGDYSKALKNYDMAMKLNSQYERARLNKAIVLDRMRMIKKSAKS